MDSLVGNNVAGTRSSLDCFGGGSAGQNAPPTGVLPSAGLTHRMLTVRGHNEACGYSLVLGGTVLD